MLTTFEKKNTFLLKKLNKTENTPSLLGSNKLKKIIFSSASKLSTFAVISRYIHTVYSLIIYYNYSI